MTHPPLGGQTVQPRRLHVVDLQSRVAARVHAGEVVEGDGLPLSGRREVPFQGPHGIRLRQALSILVHRREVVLGAGVALSGRCPEPPHRLGFVLRQPPSLEVGEPDGALRVPVSPPGRPKGLVRRYAGLFRIGVGVRPGRNGSGARGVRFLADRCRREPAAPD